MGRIVLVAAPLLLASLLDGCGSDHVTAPVPSLAGAGNGSNGKNAVVRVTPQSDTLDALYDTLLLAANAEVSWSSLTPAVATVDPSGRVVSIGSGLGLIQATGIGGRKADTAEILVQQLVTSVRVLPDSLELEQGLVDTLTAVAADANGFSIVDALVTWVSDMVGIATVSGGVVTAVDTGTTTIRATAGGVTGTAWLKVLEAPATPYP